MAGKGKDGAEPDIPKCDLPAKKAAGRAAKKPRAARKAAPRKKPAPAPEKSWDVAAEAKAAKAAAFAKERERAGPVERPEGAISIPSLSKGKRKKAPEPPAGVAPVVETKRERTARLKAEIAASEEAEAKRIERLRAEIRKRDDHKINEEVFFEILLMIAEGHTLRSICRMPGMPSRSTFHYYVNCEDERIAAVRFERLARARALGMDELSEEVLEIVDDRSGDYVDGDDGPILDRENIQRAKLRAETRLKLLAVWEPTRYGARVNHADADGKPLRGSGMSAGDLAIGLAKLIEAAKRNDLPLAKGVVIDQEPRE